MASQIPIPTTQIIQLLVPKPFLRFIKSSFFLKKHFTKIFFTTEWALPPEINTDQPMVVLVGHSNYLESEGGTEKIIIDQVENLLSTQKNNIFIYPKWNGVKILQKAKYGVILNGYELLELKESQLLAFFQRLKIQELHIHHLLHWPLTKFVQILTAIKSKTPKILVYSHDFYFSCPKVNKFCMAGALRCKDSYYSWLVQKWRICYQRIWELADEIRVPSEFMKQQMDENGKQKTSIFNPLSVSTGSNSKPTIAYLGVDSPIKGYETWLNLAKNALVTRKCKLIHIGKRRLSLPHIPSFDYSFQNSKENIASDLLKTHNVNFVVIWSQVPESYSFTFHEAKIANKPVITTPKSGNIAFEISKNQSLGVVLSTEYKLVQFLLNLGSPQ